MESYLLHYFSNPVMNYSIRDVNICIEVLLKYEPITWYECVCRIWFVLYELGHVKLSRQVYEILEPIHTPELEQIKRRRC